MDKQLFGTFKKIERQLEEKKQAVIRDAENRRLEEARRIIEARRRKQEIIIYSSLFIFVVGIVYLAYSFRSEIRTQTYRVNHWIASSRDGQGGGTDSYESVNCEIPANYASKACISLRQSDSDAKWKSITVNKTKPFGIAKESK
jgi:hypothetical protein